MGKKKIPSTPALRLLRAREAAFTLHHYRYEDRGGTEVSSRELGVPENAVIKTLIMEDDQKRPMVVLMHGDCSVSTRSLARHLGVKGIQPCVPKVAEKHSGYRVGGTSPFGVRSAMPVYAEETIQLLDVLYINAGCRGLLMSMHPDTLEPVLEPEWVSVALP